MNFLEIISFVASLGLIIAGIIMKTSSIKKNLVTFKNIGLYIY